MSVRIYMPHNYAMDGRGALYGSHGAVYVAAEELPYTGDMYEAIEEDYDMLAEDVLSEYTLVEESNFFSHPDYIAHLRGFVFTGGDGVEMMCVRIYFLMNDVTAENGGETVLLTYTVLIDPHEPSGDVPAVLDEIERCMDVQFPPVISSRVAAL